MNNFGGALGFEATVGEADFNKAFNNMERRVTGFVRNSDKEISSLENSFKRLGQIGAGYLAFNQLSGLPGQIVKIRGEFQQLDIAFTTMLKSKAASDKLMGEVVQLAASTPFGLKEAAQATKQLLAYGSSANEVVNELRMLGDVAAGVSAPIGELAYLYGTLRTQGRAFTVDIRQFAGRGIPIYEELGKVLGVATGEVSKFVEEGKVGFAQVQQAFKNMSGSGGAFENLMAKQSKSLTGLTSQFSDAVDIMFNKIGEQSEGLAATAISSATSIVENYEPVLKVLTVLVATYGTYRAALIAISVAQGLVSASSTATLFLEMAKGLGTVTAATYGQAVALGVQTQAQAALNAVMAINPYVAAATAIIALAGAVWVLSDSTTASEAAQISFNKILEDQKKAKQDLISQTAELTGIIGSETSTNFAQIQAYKTLQGLYPKLLGNLDLHAFKLLKAADAQKLLNGAIDQIGFEGQSNALLKAQKNVDALSKKLEALKKQSGSAGIGASGLTVPIVETEKALAKAKEEAAKLGAEIKKDEADAWAANTPVEEQIKHYEKLKDALVAQRSGLEENILKIQKLGGHAETVKSIFEGITLTGLNQQIDWFATKVNTLKNGLLKEADPNAKDGGNKTFWEGEKKKAQDAIDAMGAKSSGSSEWKKRAQDIKDADKQLEIYNVKEKRVRDKKVAERDKPQPFGSIAYYEQIARKADEIISKTPGSNTAEITKQNAIKLAAEKSADEIRKQNAIKTFDEELEEKKKKYELYQMWVNTYTDKVAEKAFPDLISKGKSYAEYLQGLINELEKQEVTSGVGLIAPEKDQLVKLKVEYSEVTNAEKPLETFQKRLDSIRNSANSLTDEIEALKKVQSELSPTDMSPDGIAMRQNTSQQLVEAQAERKKQLKDYLVAVAGSEAKENEIRERYRDLRIELDQQYADKKTAIYKKALDKINKDEQDENNEQQGLLATQSTEFKALTKIIQNSTAEQTKIRVDAAKKQLQKILESYGEESDEYRQALQNLRSAEEDHKQKSIRMWGMVSDAVGQLGEILQEMGGSIGEVGGALSGLSGQFGNISQAFSTNSDGTTSMNQYAAAIQGVIQIVGTLVSASKKRHEAEKAFALARLGFENDYQLALNSSIGESYKAGDNIFNKDIDAKIKAGVKQYDDAQKSYQDAIAKLDEGRAKKRQKNVVDGKTVGQLAGAGAAAGAVIGGIVGVGLFSVATAAVGAVIGGAIGAISGLFAKKKKDVYGGLMEEYPDLVTQGADGWKSVNVEMARALITNGQVDDKTKEMLETAIAYNEQLEKSKEQIKEGLSELVGGLGDSIRDALVNAFKEGTDAAQAFGKAVGDVIADMTAKLLFTSLFQDAFNKLQADMVASYAGGDGIITDDLATFFQENKEKPQQYVEGLQAISDAMDKFGFKNIFGKKSSAADPLAGAIQGMSAETAGLLAGQFNAIRITNADISQSMRQSLIHLYAISQNTSYNKNLLFLADVVDELKKMNSGNSVRPYGLG